MIIYVVKEGDTVASIANQFSISEVRLIHENGIQYPNNLVTGQTIVITNPQETYVVKEGDSLASIAVLYNITLMELYRNNPYLWEKEFIEPGEILIISYSAEAEATINGYAFPFVDYDILKYSLPYLTYLSIMNYKTLRKGDIESFYDDTSLINIAKSFGVAPLMLVTSVTFRGERNPEMIYEILLNPEYQDRHAQSMLTVLKEKGYYGVNITITFLNETTQELYKNYLERITSRLNKEGYPVFITIDPNFSVEDNRTLFEPVDFSSYNDLINEAYVMRFFWGTWYVPPMPVSSVKNIAEYVSYMLKMIEPNKINVGFPLLGYDWVLPYIEGISHANAVALDTAIDLARSNKSIILFDDESETPYFEYQIIRNLNSINHIVWFVDARTIYAIIKLALDNDLQGTGLWNIMTYYPQLWLLINANFKIVKLIPEE